MSIVPHGETCAAFCFLSLLLMAAPSLQLRHRHLIVALHGHQLMQPVAFLAVIVVALVFLGYERLNFRNDILALWKLLRCAQLVKLTLGSVVDDKIRFMRGIELLPVLFFADRTILLDNGICFLRLPDVLGTRFTPAINSCGLSSDGLRRLLSRSDDPGWGSCPLLSSPTGNDPAFPKLALLAHSHAGGHGASFGSAITESLLPEKAIRLSRNTVPPGSNCYRLRHRKGCLVWKPFNLQRTFFRQKAGCVFANIL